MNITLWGKKYQNLNPLITNLLMIKIKILRNIQVPHRLPQLLECSLYTY